VKEEGNRHLGHGHKVVQAFRKTLLFDNRVVVLVGVLDGGVVVSHYLEFL
jgi:hypothetical protein